MPKLERIIAGAAQLGRPAQPGDFGTGAGVNELALATAASAQMTEQLFKAAEQAAIGKARSGLAVELNDFRIKLKSRPDHTNDIKDFEEFRRQATEKHRGGILTERGRRQFDDDIFDIVERARVDTTIGARNKALGQQRADTAEEVQDFLNLFIDSDDDMARKKHFDDGIAAINRTERDGGFTPEKAEQLRSAFEAEALAGLAFRMINEAQSPNDAQEVVEELENPEGVFKTMDSTARQKAIQSAKGRVTFETEKVKTNIKWLQSQAALQKKVRLENGAIAMMGEMIAGNLTTQWVSDNLNNLSPAAIKEGMAAVARGGGFAGPAFDPVEVMRVSRIEADDPLTFKDMELSFEKLGTLFPGFVARQREARSKPSDLGPTPAKSLQNRIAKLEINDVDGARFHDLFWARHAQWRNEHEGRTPGFADVITILNTVEAERKDSFLGFIDVTPDLEIEAERVHPGVPQELVRSIVKMIQDENGIADKAAVDNVLAEEARKAGPRALPNAPRIPDFLPDIPPPPPPRPGSTGGF